ncbi:MAG TPA: tetratricopeptide repeat protein [Candidatus Acidoferrales bacterium]|nr:tetratricopeptide repeat protein [Candidatus Acidoferrales bacterium]
MKRLRLGLVVILSLTALYDYAWPTPTIHYYVSVVLHLVAGIALLFLLLFLFRSIWRNSTLLARAGWSSLALGGAVGVVLIFTGTPRADFPILYVHIALCIVGVALLFASYATRGKWLAASLSPASLRWGIIVLVFAVLVYGAWWTRSVPWQHTYQISNPAIAPATMNQEGGGPSGPYFPGSVEVSNKTKIPAKFFLESETCKTCHADIYRQWSSSAHHFSSFNNQWYRKSIEYMQDTIGVRPSKWCAGCHDPALLLTGMFDRPVREIENTPEGQAGLGCVMCHSIVAVQSTMGQNGYVLAYSPLDQIATSKNPVVHNLVDFLIKLNPEPHRRSFLKPFVRNQTAEFCSTCHKVHLDFPVNHYRWTRGFNEYDNWQASGISGKGARSFYYPPKPETCTDCHMPAVRSADFGNYAGIIHSHRFPGANTALPYENEDTEQLDTVEKFLEANQVSVDIFGISPEAAPPATKQMRLLPNAPGAPQLQTTFGVGEESEFRAPTGQQRLATRALQLTAPFGRVPVAVRRGDTVRVDVVVRTRNVGHFFPGGTVDAFDLWLELTATDENGRTIFWSGEAGKNNNTDGSVDPGAQFYRALLVDAHGNPINKRNAWAERAVVYVRLIPPGAADTLHYRMYIPKNVGDRITLTAKLNYRKFSWWFTQFAFGGVHDSNQHSPLVSPAYDDTKWVFTGDTKDDSGKRPGIPNLPIVVMAHDKAELQVLPPDATPPEPHVAVQAADWQRWNDYGIGLLLQGDLQGAGAAFQEVAKAAPNRADGWVNMGRVQLQEGNLPEAEKVLLQALKISPSLASAHFFYGNVLRDQGHYDEAIAQFKTALEQYPTDRVALNDVGRTLFLERRYADAIREFQSVLAIDPEDVEANYNLMLCYTGMGQPERAHDYEVRYLRFKANEAEGALLGPYLRNHPDDNNERQPIHELTSAPLAPAHAAYSSGKSLSRMIKPKARR